MLRPEKMSRVSVTGSKSVMDDVIEAVHDLNLVHLSDYEGEWEDFEPGDPMANADEVSETLVTVRSIESILDLDEEDLGPTRAVKEEEIEERLAEIRARVNELDDERTDLRDQLREVEEEIDTVEPFADLGIDLDLLSGYDSLSVVVGEGDPDAVREAVDDLDVPFEVFSGQRTVAVFARTDETTLEEALVGADFTSIEVPDAEGSPEEYVQELEHERSRLEQQLEGVESDIESVKLDAAGFLLAVEEELSIEVQKAEAPLSFATTENAFVAEGWIPSDRYADLESGLEAAVGDHVEVEELERARYDRHGHPATTEETREVTTDGGHPTGRSEPPIVQDNPGPVKPFEVLTKAVGRPNYSELDPTIILFLTFPAFFGFMIGDVGYGLVYMTLGYFMYTRFDSDGIQGIAIVGAVAGFATAFFGFMFGEIFGLHLITTYVWDPLIHGPPLKKGLMPANAKWAMAWFTVTAIVGVLHLNIAYVFEFVEGWELHGPKEAILESASWLLAVNGLWLFIFSTIAHTPGPEGTKPDFLFEVFSSGDAAALPLGFTGFPEWVGFAGIGALVLGYLLIGLGPTYELIEFHVPLAHPLSYLRIGAEVLAEVGLAFAVNLLFWGVYATGHGNEVTWHFALGSMPAVDSTVHGHAVTEIMFPGLVHMGPIYVLLGIFVMIVGHLIVISLGVMSVGIQAVRLEYFEFFSKFYEGEGTPYNPFGYDREYTPDES